MRDKIDTASVRTNGTRVITLASCLRHVGASEFSTVAGSERLGGRVSGVRLVTSADDPMGRGDLVLVDGSRDLCWTILTGAARAGAAALVVTRDWAGPPPAMLAALADRLGIPILAWNAETTWESLKTRFQMALADQAAAEELDGFRSWGPSTLLDLLDGHLQRLPNQCDVRPGACVLAFSAVQSTKVPGPDDEALDRAIWLSLLDPDVPSDAEGVRIGQFAYVVIRHGRSEMELRTVAEHLRRLLSVTLDREVLAAIGSPAADAAELTNSRIHADRVLVLAHRRTTPCTSTLADVQHLALLEQAAAVLAAQPHLLSQKLATLRRSDATRNTSYVAVLRAFLDHFGDVNTSAERLGMHHNTFRYRLKRGVEIAGINLDDPSERLALQVELALDV